MSGAVYAMDTLYHDMAEAIINIIDMVMAFYQLLDSIHLFIYCLFIGGANDVEIFY